MQETLIKEKREVSRLTVCLDHILKQLNENAPIFQQLREDYTLSRAEISTLKEQLNTVEKQRQTDQRITNELKARSMSLEQENRTLDQDCKDLSLQVQTLLNDLENVGGNIEALEEGLRVVKRVKLNQSADDQQGSDAHDIITQRLVAIHSIADLQSQNQKMRRSLRTLSKQLEERNVKYSEQHMKDIEMAKQALTDLEEQLRVQALKCESFIRERDQWKRIAESRTVESVQSSPGRVQNNDNTDDRYQIMYTRLQHDFDAYRKEIGVDSKLLKEELIAIQQSKNELSVNYAKLTMELGYQQERFKSTTCLQDAQVKEHTDLRERIGKLAETITRQDAKIQQLTNQILESRDQLELAKNESRQLRIEKEIAKQSEGRLCVENKSLVIDRNRGQEMIRDLHRIHDDTERINGEMRVKIEERLSKNEKEL